MSKTILVIGSGGREHALCWGLSKSADIGKIFCAPGNGGIARLAECVGLPSHEEVVRFCRERKVDLVVIGPEQPLTEGLSDHLRAAGMLVFGPSKAAAQLEGSKGFAKDICTKYNVPTGAYGRFNDPASAKDYLARQAMPIVIKADGLAAGKGVVIAHRRREADRIVDEMFSGAFGAAGKSIVIEEFLEGEEISFFALCDGETAVEFGSAQDHKAAYDGDKGPNTGGMGAYSPAPVMTPELSARIMREIVLPVVRGMKKEGVPYHGVLFAGLMITLTGPKVIEFNARFGDPEAQVLIPRLGEDFAALLLRAASGKLPQSPLKFKPHAALCVVMAAKGYPGAYEKGSPIRGLEKAEAIPGVTVFHAGTVAADSDIRANGGRVLGVTALAPDVTAAQALAYRAVDAIDWPEGFCRRDIGWRALRHEKEKNTSNS